ncbi:phosphoheptose isomerase [Sedimenticola selenatireducens]|uniref:phosphoheptose isomerase n=1 Tax=Sedimenticola selenatireducens TaxID=191960 RepID=UPI003F4ADAE5
MNLIEHINETFHQSVQLQMESLPVVAEPVARSAELIVRRLLEGGKILTCGNGGSAGNAQHFSSIMLNRFDRERPGLPAIALTTDSSTLTAIANDYDYDEIFAKQIRTLGHPGDLLLAITTSGNSENVNAAIAAAHERKMLVIALNGRDGGRLSGLLQEGDEEICIPAESTARVLETHLLIIHCLCDLIDKQLLGN